MNCRECERVILGEDGEPSAPDAAAVTAHVQTCPRCRELQSALSTALKQWQSETNARDPDPAASWRELRPHLAVAPRRRRRLAPVFWLAAPLAAAAAAVVLFVQRPAPTATDLAFISARADFVEAGNPGASTVVYVDNDSGWLVVWAADAER